MQLAQYQESAYRQDKLPPLKPAAKVGGINKVTQAMGVKLPWSRQYTHIEPLDVIETGLDISLEARKKGRFLNHRRWVTQAATWYGQLLSIPLLLISFHYHTVFILGVFFLGDAFFTFDSKDHYWDFFPIWGGGLVLSLVVRYLIAPYLPERLFIKDKGTGLLRETGMVRVKQGGRLVDYPFVEFDCFIINHANQHGAADMRMVLWHRYDPSINFYFTLIQPSVTDLDVHYQGWELIQRYMDVSQPLPDIPDFEPFRHLDPTTVAYDKKHHRTKDRWAKMTLDSWREGKQRKRQVQQAGSVNWRKYTCMIEQHIAECNQAA